MYYVLCIYKISIRIESGDDLYPNRVWGLSLSFLWLYLYLSSISISPMTLSLYSNQSIYLSII